MIKWYLVMWLFNGGMINIPEPYNSEIECHNAGGGFENIKHICVKAPVISDYTCSNGNIAVPCERSVPTHTNNPASKDKGYVCQPGANECQIVK